MSSLTGSIKKCHLIVIFCTLLLIMLAANGCSSGDNSPVVPTATRIIMKPTAEPTPVLPRSGHWEGDPSVSLDISGTALSIEMVVSLGKGSTCTMSTSATLNRLYFRTLSISGTFSDQENVSGDYVIVMCGGLLPTPVSGKWNAHWVNAGD